MQPMPLEHWMEIAVLETLLDTWLEHKGARDPAYAALDREFRSALGPDFDISVFDSLDSAHLVESKYIRKRGLAKGTTARNDVKRRHLKDLRCEWNATQSMGLRDGQRMLEFQSLAQRYSQNYFNKCMLLVAGCGAACVYRRSLADACVCCGRYTSGHLELLARPAAVNNSSPADVNLPASRASSSDSDDAEVPSKRRR
jgi:hypothetical protein